MKLISYMFVGLCVSTWTNAIAETSESEMIATGEALHQAHCTRCHDSQVYTRKNRMINQRSSLETHVQRCATNLDIVWFEEEVAAVAAYLNANYYLFDQNTPKDTPTSEATPVTEVESMPEEESNITAPEQTTKDTTTPE